MSKLSISVADAAKILRVSRDRIEQSISRNVFLPRAFSDPGKPREWTFDEVMRLALFFRLTDSGRSIDAKMAGILTGGGFYGFHNEPAYFVVYRGNPDIWLGTWSYRICRAREVAEMLSTGVEYPFVLAAGNDAETIKHNSEKHLGPVYACLIINLNEIENEVKAKWPQATGD